MICSIQRHALSEWSECHVAKHILVKSGHESNHVFPRFKIASDVQTEAGMTQGRQVSAHTGERVFGTAQMIIGCMPGDVFRFVIYHVFTGLRSKMLQQLLACTWVIEQSCSVGHVNSSMTGVQLCNQRRMPTAQGCYSP